MNGKVRSYPKIVISITSENIGSFHSVKITFLFVLDIH